MGWCDDIPPDVGLILVRPGRSWAYHERIKVRVWLYEAILIKEPQPSEPVRLATRYCGRDNAADVISDFMDKRLEKIFDNYNPNRGSFCGYFLTSLRNYCVDMCRGKARLVLLGQNNPQTPQQQGNDPWADFLRALRDQVLCDWIPEKSWDTLCREFQTILTEIIALSEGNIKQFFECLKHCTEQLEPRQCQVWVMRHALDMSPPNISNELRITKEYVRVIIAQANHKLRRCMAECFSPVVIDSSNK